MSTPSAPNVKTNPRASPQTLEFAWDPPSSDGGSPITEYLLEIDGGSTLSQTLSASARYYRVTGLTNGQTYRTTLKARNTNGYGPTASFRDFEPGSPPSVPPSTATVVAGDISGSAIIGWGAPSVTPDAPVRWYTISSFSYNAADPHVKATGDGLTQTSYRMTGLNKDSIYRFGIRAVNAPGYSAQTTYTSSVVEWDAPKFNGAYILNATISFGSKTDSAGNRWVFGSYTNPNLPVSIYNRLGQQVGLRGAVAGGPPTYFVAYISADGLTNVWICRIQMATSSIAFNTNINDISRVDGSGNFILALRNIRTSGFGFGILDKNGVSRYSSNAGANSDVMSYICKFSPAGAPSSGNFDANWWVVRTQVDNVASFISYSEVVTLEVDRKNNIVVLIANAQSTGSTNSTAKFYSRDNSTLIGSFTVPAVATGGGSMLSVVKIAANGTTTDSWISYFARSSGSGFTRAGYSKHLAINSQNQIVLFCQMRSALMTVYGSDNTAIGANPIPNVTDANSKGIVVRLAEDGTAASSWRSVIGTATGITRDELAMKVLVDADDNIICLLNSFGTAATTLVARDASDTSTKTAATIGYDENSIIRLNNSGTPLWIASVKGIGGYTATNCTSNFSNVNTDIFLGINESIYMKGYYTRSTLGLYNANQSSIFNSGSPVGSGAATTWSYIARFTSSGLSTTLARVTNQLQNINSLMYNAQADNLGNIYLYGVGTQFSGNSYAQLYNGNTNTILANPVNNLGNIGANNNHAYVARYNSELSSVTYAKFGVTLSTGTVRPQYLLVDSNRDVIIAGFYTSSPIAVYNFGNTSQTVPNYYISSSGAADIFMTKFATSSNTNWTAVIGSTNADIASSNVTDSGVTIRYQTVNQDSNGYYNIIGNTNVGVPDIYDGSNRRVSTMFLNAPTGPSSFMYAMRIPSNGRV